MVFYTQSTSQQRTYFTAKESDKNQRKWYFLAIGPCAQAVVQPIIVDLPTFINSQDNPTDVVTGQPDVGNS